MSGVRIPGRLQYLSEETGRELLDLVQAHAPWALAGRIQAAAQGIADFALAEGLEAGRLAAIRAEVERALTYFRKEARTWQFVAERSAAEARYMGHVDPPTMRCELFTDVDRRLAAGQQERAARDAGRARAAVEALGDVTRWLEATR